jgi:hypothetical protein
VELTEVLAIAGGALHVLAGRSEYPGAADDWFSVQLQASAPPFEGTVETTWFTEDLVALRDAVAALADGAQREFVIGGNRAAELRLDARPAIPATGELAVRVRLTPSGDDPSVVLQFDGFEAPATFGGAVPAIERVLAAERL